MTAEPTSLPDLAELEARATTYLDHWNARLAEAQANVDKGTEVLYRITGRTLGGRKLPPARQGAPRPVSDSMYRSVLHVLTQHDYCGMSTLKQGSGASQSAVSRSVNVAIERGHAQREKRGRKYRYRLTDTGLEFLVPNQNGRAPEHDDPRGVADDGRVR